MEARKKAENQLISNGDWIKAMILCCLAMIAIGLLAVAKIDEVCRMEADELDQLMELRIELETMHAEMYATETETDQDTLSDADRDTIERIVAAESRGEPYEGQLAVAQTIKDRGDLWGMRYIDVATAPGQYARPYDGDISSEVSHAVADVFDAGVRAYEEPVTHFCEASITPYWAEDKVGIGVVGNHKFYR